MTAYREDDDRARLAFEVSRGAVEAGTFVIGSPCVGVEAALLLRGVPSPLFVLARFLELLLRDASRELFIDATIREFAALIQGSVRMSVSEFAGFDRQVLTSQSRIWFETLFRVPDEALGNKVDEEVIVRAQNLSQCLGVRSSSPSFRVDDRSRRPR